MVKLSEVHRRGPGHPGLPDRKLLPPQAQLDYPKERREREQLPSIGLEGNGQDGGGWDPKQRSFSDYSDACKF
jgi:hypothetical protein